ncbi:hypothetical protein MGSAQ_001351 [marine sediment metagenome]|uniref:Uncharacterized protein n=1 Tax=marine sediment metagenome TaxID=412755 RepID=A0A1B6NUW3_9ZZZZ
MPKCGLQLLRLTKARKRARKRERGKAKRKNSEAG